MSTASEFYLARAAECTRDAERATLDNVRDRYQRAAEAWMVMADRIAHGEAMRDTLAAAKAAQTPATVTAAG